MNVFCVWLFFHNWEKWLDCTASYTILLSEFDGVPADKIGTPHEYQRQAQTRVCKDCGRRQIRKV